MSQLGISFGPGITIGPGVTVEVIPPLLLLSLDAGNPASYPGTGTTWTDTVGSLPFTLYGGVTYNSANGGYLSFDPASTQYANCSTSLSSLGDWSVEVWHYYTDTNSGFSPCIVTEVYRGNTLNYALGSLNDNTTGLMAGWYNGSWNMTPYTLTAGNWYHIVGTCDGTTTKLYVNNTLVEQVAASGNPESSNGGITLMKRWDPDNVSCWGGALGIVKIWNGVLTQENIAAEWNATRTRFGL